MNHDISEHIKEQVIRQIGHRSMNEFFLFYSISILSPEIIHRFHQEGREVKFFFDEFEFFRERVPIIKGGYYTSSPNVEWDFSQTRIILSHIFESTESNNIFQNDNAFALWERYQRSLQENIREINPFEIENTGWRTEQDIKEVKPDSHDVYWYRLGVYDA
jgi:hypothetical protein